MPTPTPTWQTCRVYGTYRNIDGTAKTGELRFTLAQRVVDNTSDVIFPGGQVLTAVLGVGATPGMVDLQFPISDDPDTSPTGWQVLVTEKLDDGSGREYVIEPTTVAAANGGVNLRTVVIPEGAPYVVAALVRGVPNGVAALNADGDVVDASGAVVQSVDVSGLATAASVTTLTTTVSGKYVKPGGGIPSTDLTTAVTTSLGKADTATQPADLTAAVGAKYTKPGPGIPSTDMASAVVTSLGKADTATQPAALATAVAGLYSTSAATTRITVEEGRYRRTLSELRGLSAGADIRPLVEAAFAAVGGTAGAELVLPEGDWVMSSAASGTAGILVTTPGVTLRGAGRNKTKVTCAVSRNVFDFQGTSVTPLTDVGISDMTITGAGSGSGTAGNQRVINMNYVNGVRIRNVSLAGAGNNGLNMFYCSNGLIEDLEISDVRDFGTLMYRSNNLRFIDTYIHDIGVAGRANLALQFKSSQNCWAIRPRIVNIQGYGFYTWDDSLDLVNYPDTSHWLIDPHIVNMTSGGTFSATSAYINVTPNMQIRGGRYKDSAGGLISCVGTKGLRISDIPEMTGAASSAIGISGAGTNFRISNVHADGLNAGNPIGIIVSGTPAYGSIRNSSFLNGSAGASSDNAACRIESTVTGLVIEGNDFSDYGVSATQRRGMYDRTASGANYWRMNKATGNTGTNKSIPVGSEDFQNSPTRPVVLGTVATLATIDTSAGLVQTATLGANVTVTTISNGVVGAELTLILTQDATGSRTVTWPATVTWAGGTAPTLSTVAAKVDILRFVYDGTKWREIARSLGQ